MCKEYVEFLRQRCLIEEQYGKALVKLAKSSCTKDEMGCIRGAWDSVRNHTETIGLNHVQASSQLAGEVAKVTDFLDTSRDQRRWAEEGARALQTQLRGAHKRMVEVKRGYEARCREEIQANHQYHQEVARCGVADRAAQRHSKSVAMLEQAEQAYRAAVAAVEEARASWQGDTEAALDTFQEIAVARLRVLRDSAWTSANISSACCVADDSALEDTRQSLEAGYSSLEAVLQRWVDTARTGEPGPPPPVECEWSPTSATLGMGHMEQQKQLSYDTASLGAGAGQSSGHAPAAPPTSQSCTHLAEVGRSRSDLGYTRPPAPHPPPMMSPKKPPRMYQYGASQASSRRKSMAETHTVNIPISVENGEYFGMSAPSSSDYHSDLSDRDQDHSPRGRQPGAGLGAGRQLSVDRAGRHQPRQARVVADYSRKHFTELSLAANTVVRVLEGRPHSDWWRVETEQGLSGFYPATYLRHI